jgi:hypothetical protein
MESAELTGGDHLIIQVTESVTSLLEGLEALYLCGRVVELVIMLGSTPINPKVRHFLKSSLQHLVRICTWMDAGFPGPARGRDWFLDNGVGIVGTGRGFSAA